MINSKTINIIIADDNATNRFVLKGLLKRLGLTASVAVDGEKAIELAKEHRPTLILMDIQMPKMNGIEAAIIIRREFPEARVPIIAVTAYPDSAHLAEYEAADFDSLIAKPVTLSELKEVLSGYLDLPNTLNASTA